MDYKQIYNEAFDTTWQKIKSLTINDLKTAKENKRNFSKTFDKVTAKLTRSIENLEYYFSERNLEKCVDLFHKRNQLYDANLDQHELIFLILKNEVQEEYHVIENSGYEEFIKTLAELQSTKTILSHFYTYKNYYELIYNQNRYEYFYAKNIDGISYHESKEYNEMQDIQYPDRHLYTTTPEKETSKPKEPEVAKITTRERICNEFNTQERAVLIHLLRDRLKLKDLDRTVLIKLLLIIGSTEKFEIFDVPKASDTNLYKQSRKGYSVFKQPEQSNKIAILKIKLINNGLKFIAEELQIDYSQNFIKK